MFKHGPHGLSRVGIRAEYCPIEAMVDLRGKPWKYDLPV